LKLPWDALFARAAGVALAEHPAMLGEWIEGEGIRPRAVCDIGVAVAVGPDGSEGLLAPVLRDCARRAVTQLASDLLDLVARARARRLPLVDQEGGTFTITNLGMFGVDGFTPLVLPSQAAILGIGRISDRLVVLNGEGVVRKMCTLSLAFDHRVVDGVPAAAFLVRLAGVLESAVDPSELWDEPSPSTGASGS
jgi:pyruvate dehydrogenase E2 component (dihydrolipoamide acetyltransferase)